MTKNNTKQTLKNRILSGLLAVMMIAGIFGTWPITIFSEEPVAQNDAVYVSVASLGYASNQEALDAGEILYLNLVDIGNQLFGLEFTKQGIVDENGNPLPDYLAYNDTRMFNTREGWASGNTYWEMNAAFIWQYIGPGMPYAIYCEPGADYSNWIVIREGDLEAHNFVATETVAPTCMQNGYTDYVCTDCGATYRKETLPVAHDFQNSVCTMCGLVNEYVPVADLGYKSNQEALDAGEVLYIDAYSLAGMNHSYVDENGNPCPQWLAYNDETVYTGWTNNTQLSFSGMSLWDFLMRSGYDSYIQPGEELSMWIAIYTGNRENEPDEEPTFDLWDGSVANSFGGGSGTAQDPYLIYTGAQLAYLASKTNNGTNYSGKYFKLMNDIDLNGIEWTPIGVSDARIFSGNFDGNFFTIYNISISRTMSSASIEGVGFFGNLTNATIQNLGLMGCDYNVIGGRAGALCGVMIKSTISNCFAEGYISYSAHYTSDSHGVGGLIGDMRESAKLINCYAQCEVILENAYTTPFVGGLVGFICGQGSKTIINCYANSAVSSTSTNSGGLIGSLYYGTLYVQNCFSNSTVNSKLTNMILGGKLEYNSPKCYISNCYYPTGGSDSFGGTTTAVENFTSQAWLSGTLGWDFDSVWELDGGCPTLQGFLEVVGGQVHTHAYTETQRENPTCGIGGYIRYTCSDCGAYYDEILPALDHAYSVSEAVEPTCQADGYRRYTCEHCGNYYDEVLSAPPHAYSVSEVVEATCQKEGYTRYTCERCLDYYDEAIAILRHKLDANNYCTMCGKYIDKPIADVWDGSVANNFGGGIGTLNDPYLIYTGAELAYLASLVNAGNSYGSQYFKLMCNIDLNNVEWVPIGKDLLTSNYAPVRPFSGNFDGNGYTISNLFIANNDTSFAGLFGTTNGATIQNLMITDADITNSVSSGPRSKAGGLIGLAVGTTISNCGITDSKVCAYAISNPSSAGGLVGIVSGNCYIYNCYVSAEVISNGHVGGIVGGNYGGSSTIQNSYSAGTVIFDGPTNNGVSKVVAGIIAYSQSTVNVQNCFTCVKLVIVNSGSESSQISPDSIYTNNAYHSISSGYNINSGTYTSEANFQSKEWLIANLGWDFENVWGFDNSNGYVYPILLGFDGIGGGNKCEHVYTETIVDPTCTTDGYTRYTCERCGYAYNGNYVLKYGHTIGEWIIDYEPTCTSSGRKHSECSVCGQQLENIYISSLGHSLVTVVTREVTCTTPGILTHTCERCSYSYSTYIYSEHAYAVSEQVQPTCYTDGYTLYTCSKCQDAYTESIPGGHNYQSFISKVATSEEDGEITYTCEGCGDSYTQIIPAREAASVLLIQDKYPWSENNNVALLTQMLADGYITGWDITTTANFKNVDIGMYNVILIANDQTSATYSQLNYLGETLVQVATAGGVVIYGACDSGWGGGYINYSLPEGVVKKNFYSRYNYIVDTDHLIVSGVLTDGKALTNNLLYGNYCSHSAFETGTLPAGANVILQDAHGDATLVEYAVGDGHIILSGLTWEFYYNRNCYDGRTNTSYTKNVYDDLIVYALYLSDPCEHIYSEGEIVAPTCTEDGYTLHTCQNCGVTMKDEIVEAIGHTEGEWQVTVEATQYKEGLKELCCVVCNEVLRSEVLPPVGGAAARVECDFDTIVIGGEVVFTFVVENCDPVTSLNIVPVFDTDIFEIVRVEWLLGDAVHQEIEEGTYISTSIWNEPININGAVYRIVLRVKQITNYPSIGFTLKIEDKENAVTVVPKVVEVTECKHTETRTEAIDDTYHAYVCENCGHAVMAEHIFDDIYDVDCNECAHTRCLKGDVDNDGDVDVDDCIYLVYSVFFGTTDYPVYQDLDFDGDGVVGSEDGVYLLRYIYYGAGEYPLH